MVRMQSSDSVAREENLPDRNIEEQYSRKTPLEHVLLRPGMYVGPVERLPPNQCWVVEPTPPPQRSDGNDPHPTDHTPTVPDNNDKLYIVRKEYGLVPALIKIFDEILVNASDNRLRNPETCTKIDVVIDPGDDESGREPFISVVNNGKGIPVQVGKKPTHPE